MRDNVGSAFKNHRRGVRQGDVKQGGLAFDGGPELGWEFGGEGAGVMACCDDLMGGVQVVGCGDGRVLENLHARVAQGLGQCVDSLSWAEASGECFDDVAMA